MSNVFTTKKMRVPGLLPDDALQEQLRQYSTRQREQPGPVSTSATEFADKVTRDFISNPPLAVRDALKQIKTPSTVSSAERRATQDSAIERRSDALSSSVAGRMLLGPIMGPMSALVEQHGTLSEEESIAATAERAEDARQREAAVRSKADIRTQLRGIPDEQAADMGLPVPPGGRELETLGRELLSDAQRVQEASTDRQQAEDAVAGKPGTDMVKQTWWLNAFQTAARTAGQLGTGSLKYPAILLEGAADFVGRNGDRGEIRAWLDTVDASVTKMLPGDKARAKDFVTELSAAVGSMTAFMITGYVAGAAGMPPGFAAGALGATSQGAQMYQEAESFDATAMQKWISLIAGTGLGLAEAVPIDRMFMRVDTATGGRVRRMLAMTSAGGMEEFIQEVSQALGEDITAKYIARFDPDREIDPREIVKRGLLGAITGAGAAGTVAAAGRRGGGQPPEADREAVAQGAIDEAQAILDRIDMGSAGLPLPAAEQTIGSDQGAPDPVRPPVPAPLYMRTPVGDVALEQGEDGSVALRVAPQADQQQQEQQASEYRGGTPPQLTDDGMVELTHWSAAPRAVLDPAQRGTGPLRGQERARLGARAEGNPAVDRTYYGVQATTPERAPKRQSLAEFTKLYNAENPAPGRMTPRQRQERRQAIEDAYYAQNETRGYQREGGLGEYRHTVRVDPNDLYNWYEDPLKLWDRTDQSLTEPERITQMEGLVRDAGFRGAYFSRSKLGQTAMLFDQAEPAEIVNERTGEPAEIESSDVLAMTTAEVKKKLGDAVPGIVKAAKHMTPDERAKLRKDTAAKIVEIFSKLPSAKEMAAVAVAGRAKRGWYARSAKALVDIFGAEDAPRFAALLAALSPQTSVESNAVNALTMWVNWDRAGRPVDQPSIVRLLGQSVQGGKGVDSVLPAWVNNTVTALATPDAAAIELSGPKVSSFMKNLQGVTIEVTNDTWMANFANVPQTLFKKTGASPGKGPGYIAFSTLVRQAADSASKITGEQWTPAEVQETVWSWTKALYEKVDSAGETRSALDIVRAADLTDAEIASTPDFATLFTEGLYRNLLEKGGYNVPIEAAEGSGAADGADGRDGAGAAGQGAAPDLGSLQPHLERAAARLDQLRAGALERAPDESLLASVAVEDVDMQKLPGLPGNSTGPIERVVRAARAYAESRGMPLRRQSEYVKVDPERAARIAQAYEDMKDDPTDPAVAASYEALIEETLAQYQFIKASGLEIEFIAEGQEDPYAGDLKKVLRDIDSGHLWVFPTDQGFGSLSEAQQANPLLRPTDEFIGDRQLLANDVFRIVHDFFGHGIEGSGFGARGEENAWQSHMRLFSEAALPALTSETRGQNSWVNYGPYGEQNRKNPGDTVFADQKTGIMPEWTWREGVEDGDMLAIFAGGNADTDVLKAKNALLDRANDMRAAGATPDEIWDATGFYLGVDGGWRFEITDADAQLTPTAASAFADGRSTVGATAASVLRHAKLYEAYPELRRYRVTLHRSPQGSGVFHPTEKRIEVFAPDEDEAISILLHEFQHAVQDIEGFAPGGNTYMGELYEGPRVEQARAALEQVEGMFRRGEVTLSQLEFYRSQLRGAAAYEYYRRIAGEVEARNVQYRFELSRFGADDIPEGMTREEWDRPDLPSMTESVRREDQIIISRSRTGMGFETQAAPAEDLLAAKMPGTSAARPTYKGEQTRPAAGIPMKPDAEPNDANLAKISRNFIQLLNMTTRQGRFTLKGSNVMGQYSRKQAVTRLRTWNDLSTLVHEGGHALHDAKAGQLASFTTKNEAALMTVADKLYGRGIADTAALSRADHVREGFAELFRVYVLNRNYATREFPQLTADLDAVLRTEAPDIAAGLDAVGQQFAAYLQLPSVQALGNTIMDGRRETGVNAAIQELREVGFRSWMEEYARISVQSLVNRYAPLNNVVRDLLNTAEANQGAPLDLKRANDPRVLARLAPNAGSRAMVQLTDGVMAYNGIEPITRGLREAVLISQGLAPDASPRAFDEERMHDFDTYLVALRALDEYRRYDEGKLARPPIGLGVGDVRQTVVDLTAKYGESFEKAAAIVNEFATALWHKQYAAGLMSRDVYKAGLDRQFYVPLQRDMSDKAGDFAPNAITGGRSLVRKFRGSDRQIVSPLSVLMHKTFALEQTIAQNEVVKALAQLADRAGTAGALVERVPATQLVGKLLSVEDVAKQLTKDDTITAADAQDLMTILSASIENGNYMTMFRAEQASEKGENILFFWEGGKVQAIQLKDGDVGADIINMLNGLGRENMSLGMELIAGTSTVFRTAITSWPDFLIVNFIRDQMSAWILTDVGYKPFVTGIQGVSDEIRQKQWARTANASMMIMGGMNVAALHEARVNRDVDALRSKGYLPRVFSEKGVTGAIKGLGRIVELTETGTRLGLFRNAFERAKRDGLTDWEAAIEASYLATDYIDFGLNGNRMLMWRRTIPFLNAQLQGYYKLLRTLGADEVRQRKGLMFALGAFFKNVNNLPLSRTERQAVVTGRKAWVKMVSLGLLSALLHFVFEDDEDYQETSEYLRTTGWVVPVGDGRVFYVPKPFELAMVANIVERALESASGDTEAKNRFLRGAAMTLSPPTAPPVIQTLVELVANKDFFSGREIVPTYMQALAPELQFNNYTSSFAKQVGEITGWSPMVIDHFMSGLGASAYRDMVTMTNALDPNAPSMDATDAPIARRFIRDVRRGSAAGRDFWAQASMTDGKLRQAEVTYRKYLEAGNQPAADRFLSTRTDDEKAYALLNAHFKAEYKRLNPMYRARQVNTIVSAMRREMVSALGLDNTTPFAEGRIRLSPSQKADVDELLSEYARREMRNTLVAVGLPGWENKAPMDTEKTLDLIETVVPEVRAELDRRIAKAKVYNAEQVFEAWPEVRDRLLLDREQAFLDDLVTIAKVTR